MLERSRHNHLCLFIISQDYYEPPKRTVRAIGNKYHLFKPNKFRDFQIIYQDKTSMYMTHNEFKNLTSIYWKVKYKPPTVDMTKEKDTGRYRLGLNFLFVPSTNPLQPLQMSIYSNVTEQEMVGLAKLAE